MSTARKRAPRAREISPPAKTPAHRYLVTARRPRIEEGVRTSDGTSAHLEDEGGGERLRVRNGDGCLLFEYDPRTKNTVVSVPDGDLELRAESGAVQVRARDGIEIDSECGVAIRAATSVAL